MLSQSRGKRKIKDRKVKNLSLRGSLPFGWVHTNTLDNNLGVTIFVCTLTNHRGLLVLQKLFFGFFQFLLPRYYLNNTCTF